MEPDNSYYTCLFSLEESMSDDSPNDRPQSLEDQLQEMLRRANLSFFADRQERAANESGGEKIPEAEPEPAADRLKGIREFDFKPRDIRDYLDRFVIRQNEAKKVLSVAVCDHYNHVRRCVEDAELREAEYAKHNILLLGPTGVGKTYMLRCAAKLIGVPFVKADATKFTETGYVGHDVEDLVRDLVKAADGDVELAQYGIIFLDEIDKVATQAGSGKDVSGRGVQINLLKLMEDTEVSLFSQTDLIGQMQAVMNIQRGEEAGQKTISTKHILFIVSGAFDKLAEDVKRRLSATQIGFVEKEQGQAEDSEYLRQAATQDFISYGFEPEFIGRLPVRVVCDALSIEDLQAIMLSSEENVLNQYRSDFEGYGISFNLMSDAVRSIAERAHEEKTGARGLMTVLERVFRDYKFELPSMPIDQFDVTQRTVDERELALAEILKEGESARREMLAGEVRRYASEFQQAHGIKLTFTADAITAVVDLCLEEDRTVRGLAADRFKDFEYAFKLISRNSGRSSFPISRKLITNPGDELSKRVAASFTHPQSGGKTSTSR
jgi:endopeptidase Clp ATP-binding regulatory subunit ClpX